MDDEKMIRAVLAGHALQGLLAANAGSGYNASENLRDIPSTAVMYAERLLVELKKDSPPTAAELPSCAPPRSGDEAATGGEVVQDHEVGQLTDDNATRVFTHPCCEAYGCDRPGVNTFHFTPLSRGRFCDIHVYVRPESILLEWHGKAKKARAA